MTFSNLPHDTPSLQQSNGWWDQKKLLNKNDTELLYSI